MMQKLAEFQNQKKPSSHQNQQGGNKLISQAQHWISKEGKNLEGGRWGSVIRGNFKGNTKAIALQSDSCKHVRGLCKYYGNASEDVREARKYSRDGLKLHD